MVSNSSHCTLLKRAKLLGWTLGVGLLLISANCRSEDYNKIFKKLSDLENEVQALKAELAAEKGKTTHAPLAEASPELTGSATSPEIYEALFRPQSTQAVTATAPGTPAPSDAAQKRKQELGQFGITYRSDGFAVDGLRFGAYGESLFGRKESGAGWNNGFDANRVVLLGTYQVSDDIFFNTEIEFEHGGIANDADDKLGGAIEVEQLFIDFRATDHFTWRSPGVDVVPVGYVGLFHEPTQFYSTNRPEIYNGLIPATWFAPSTGAYGKVIDGLNYQFQLSSGLEDSGTVADDEDGSVPIGGYAAGISGSDALSLARSPIGDRLQLGNNLAYTLRLSYTPEFLPGLSGSSSVYYTNNTTPRGAYGTNPNGSTRALGKSDLIMFDSEVRYRIPATGIELRAEYVHTGFGDTDNLRANNDGDATNNVGNSMYGYSFEAAYHVDLRPNSKEKWEFVPFYRFSEINLQTAGAHGSDVEGRTGSGLQQYHTFGTAIFPTPKVVLKADYQFVLDNDDQSPDQKAFLGAVGFFF